MANNMENLVLYEDSSSPLPQLSDEHLKLLNNSHESYDPQCSNLDAFNLEYLNEKPNVLEAQNQNQINQSNQIYYEYEFDQLIEDQLSLQSDQFSIQSDSNQFHTCSIKSTSVETFINQNTSFVDQLYAEQSYHDNLSNQSSTNQFNPYLDETILSELTSSNELEFNDFGNLNEFTGDLNEIDSLPNNQILYSTDYTNQFINSPTSVCYLNQVIDSSADNSPISTAQFSQVNSPATDYSTQVLDSPLSTNYQALHSPSSIDYSVQSVWSSIDYAIQSVNSTTVYPYSLSSSPLSNASNDSVESYENQDYLNYSTNVPNFNQCFNNQYSSAPIERTSVEFKKNNSQVKSNKLNNLEQKVKRKRAKKVVSEEELNRKLAIKSERKRKRLERKKVQNKEAAKRYREKKKLEEDEINKRLANVKDNYKALSLELKETLNEKKVLLKLLKDFADQSPDIILPEWMRSAEFLNSLI